MPRKGAGVLQRSRVTCHVSLVTILCLSSAVMAATTSKDHGRTAEQLAQAIDICKRLAQQTVGYDVVFRRDPMRPLVDSHGELLSTAGMSGGFSIQGIIWSDARPLAVIDDELFAQGDVVGPYTILEIKPDGVVVARGNETLLIPLDRGLEPQQEHPVELSAEAAPPASPVQGDAPAQDAPPLAPESAQLEDAPSAADSAPQ